jgi:hypothetical protein
MWMIIYSVAACVHNNQGQFMCVYSKQFEVEVRVGKTINFPIMRKCQILPLNC